MSLRSVDLSPARIRRLAAAAEVRTLVVIAAIAAGVWALLSLGGEVREGETGGWDRAVIQALRAPGHPHLPIGPRWLQDVMRDITALGGTTWTILATLLVFAALTFHGLWRRGVMLLAVVGLAQLADELLKGAYGRVRPDFAPPGTFVYAQSFPSGHSTSSAALWMSLAMIAASFERREEAKIFWFVVAGVIVVAVGFSRVFLGVHWPTDVLAGWTLGTCWALAGWLVWRLLAPRRAGL
ncbi:MAG TPA: phosphatase PAP2 family protein [Caulobacteraceae bacterium]|nr:phosphatase PAP2 family protein [Caulobacteraceae bacterium]